jgi:hypothetical protein
MARRASGLPGRPGPVKVATGESLTRESRKGCFAARNTMDILPFDNGAASPVKLHRSVEERAIATYILDANTLLETVRLSTGIAEKLARYGFDDEELAIGMALQENAAHAYKTRHAVLPADSAAGLAALTARMDKARDEFTEFRGVARAAFPDLSSRTNLRVTGDIPDDLQRFMTQAHSGYLAACEEPFTAKLSKRGYPVARLKGLLDDLDALATLDVAHELATSDAEEEMGGSASDAAYNELKEFMKEIKGVIRTVFRKQPEVLESLGVPA